MQSLQHTDCHSISQQHPERAQKPEHKEQEGDPKKKKKTKPILKNKTKQEAFTLSTQILLWPITKIIMSLALTGQQ